MTTNVVFSEPPDISEPYLFCIYCGAIDDLTDEHVVPYGLSGEHILKKASCKNCASVTTKFERDVLRNMVAVVRAKLNLKTRRKKERPTAFNLGIGRGEERRNICVPVDQHPGVFAMPVYAPAKRLNKLPGPMLPPVTDVMLGYDRDLLTDYAEGQVSVDIAVPNTHDLASLPRMIAKIGYCFAISCIPAEHWEVLYPISAILGTSNDVHDIVGASLDPIDGTDDGLHQMIMEQTGDDMTVFLRLFPALGTPWYHVVVGRLHPEGELPLS